MIILIIIYKKGKFKSSACTAGAQSGSAALNVERLQKEDSGIVVLRMNRPETKNAISKNMLALVRFSFEPLFSPYDIFTSVTFVALRGGAIRLRTIQLQFTQAVADLQHDLRNARVVILKSDVPGAFCTGADLKERATMAPEDVPKCGVVWKIRNTGI